VEQKIIKTTGDFLQENPPPSWDATLPKGLFTKELQKALLDHEIDFAVHSLKDLPTEADPRFQIAAIPHRADATDVLVTKRGFRLDEGSIVGTGSSRRKWQWQKRYPHVAVHPIRGNIDTRLSKVNQKTGVILAAAGLQRLGINNDDFVVEPLNWMISAAGQGALAVEIRSGDEETLKKILPIHCRKTALSVQAERDFLNAMGGGCMTAVAVFAHIQEDSTLHIRAAVPEGKVNFASVVGNPQDIDALVQELKLKFHE
jgi:hydroxymethylbilane synthase